MCAHRRPLGIIRGGCKAHIEREARDHDVLVRGAAAFGRDDGSVIGEGDFVEDAYQALFPAVLAVFSCVGGVLAGRGRSAVSCVGETWFQVWNPGQVECESQTWNVDIDSGERMDPTCTTEGLGREIGAVGQVEDGLVLRGGGEAIGRGKREFRRGLKGIRGGELLDGAVRTRVAKASGCW